MLRSLKCARTFLNGEGISAFSTSCSVWGSILYSGDDGDNAATGLCCGDANAMKFGVIQLKSPMSTLSYLSYLDPS